MIQGIIFCNLSLYIRFLLETTRVFFQRLFVIRFAHFPLYLSFVFIFAALKWTALQLLQR